MKNKTFIHVTKSPHVDDKNLPWIFESERFVIWFHDVFMEGYDGSSNIEETLEQFNSMGYKTLMVSKNDDYR